MGVSEFLAEVEQTLAQSSEATGSGTTTFPTKAQFELLKKQIEEVLDVHSSFGRSVKGSTLLVSIERAYSRARILTDIRNVFADLPTEKPVAAVVLHTLRITYHSREPFRARRVFRRDGHNRPRRVKGGCGPCTS